MSSHEYDCPGEPSINTLTTTCSDGNKKVLGRRIITMIEDNADKEENKTVVIEFNRSLTVCKPIHEGSLDARQ